MSHVTRFAGSVGIERITYVSGTTAREENRWFEIIDLKMQTEAILRRSGIPFIVFCPSWAMETILNFSRGDRIVVIRGKNPPPLHFLAAADFARIVAASYTDDRGIGKRLTVHGPEGIKLEDAVRKFASTIHPDLPLMHLKLWQARLLAEVTRQKGLIYVTNLIDYFDQVGESGDPSETNALYAAPDTTFIEWLRGIEEQGEESTRLTTTHD